MGTLRTANQRDERAQRIIYYLSAIGFFAIFSTTISKNPVLPLFVKELGGTDAVLGIIAALSPLAGILFSFPVGMLADRLGKRRLLLTAAIVFVSAPLLYLLVTDAWWLVPIRFFHGTATAILGPVAAALIFQTYRKRKGERIGIYSSSTLIGRTIAPILGGAILTAFAAYGGFISYHMVYVAAFVLALPVLALTLMLPKDPKVGKKARVTTIGFAQLRGGLARFFRDHRLAATAGCQMAIYFTFGAFETYLPVYLSSKGIPAYQIGLLFSVQIVSIALTQPLFGRVSDRIDRRAQILSGVLMTAACIALVPLFSTALQFIALGLAFGLGMSFATVATSSYVADLTRKSELGASVGALSAIMDIGHTLGPLLTGFILAASSFFWGFLASGVVSVLAVSYFAAAAFGSGKPSKI